MLNYHAIEGSVIEARQEFLNDDNTPIIFNPGWPKLRVMEANDTVLLPSVYPDAQTPGMWLSSVTLPQYNKKDATALSLVWLGIAVDGTRYKNVDSLSVLPFKSDRDTDIVEMFGVPTVTVKLPISVVPTMTVTAIIWVDNEPASVASIPSSDIQAGTLFSVFQLDVSAVPAASLTSYMVQVAITDSTGYRDNYMYNLWLLTAQLFKTMLQLEAFINKSRIENVIPSLRYTNGDLVLYLERGLNYFNSLFKPTSFTGLNMLGYLYEAHLLCSEYLILQAQLLAEGSLSFDFSGQSISLNVDRTPQLDAAVGRLDSLITASILPLKTELYKNGVTSGDGSIGNSPVNNPTNKGVLTLANSPTTRLFGRRTF
jgi:hypothetical protein